MARRFIKNFRQAQIYPGVTLGVDQDGNVHLSGGGVRNIYLPSSGFGNGSNSTSWTNRVAIPFSYNTSADFGDTRDYGVLYVPAYSANKITKDGEIKSEDLDIYGADLANGMSLNAKGFMDLYNKAKYADFRFGGNEKTEVKNTDAFSQLRESIRKSQEFSNNAIRRRLLDSNNNDNSDRIKL